jgi:hypothetical protein
MMVSYEYVPKQLAANRAQYIATGRVLANAEVACLCDRSTYDTPTTHDS